MQAFDVSSCLLCHVCRLVSQIGTLCTLFHGQDISFCYTTGSKLMFYVYIYAGLLYSRNSTLSTFFTVYLSVTAYAGIWCFFKSTVFQVNLLISRIGTLCTFFTVRTVRINRSVTRLAKHLCLYVYFYVCLFFTEMDIVYLFGSNNFSFCDSIYMYKMFLYVYFSSLSS